MTTFPNPSPAIEPAEHPRVRELPAFLRSAVHEQPGAGPNPSGPQPAEKSTLPPAAGDIKTIPGGTDPGAPGLPAIPKS